MIQGMSSHCDAALLYNSRAYSKWPHVGCRVETLSTWHMDHGSHRSEVSSLMSHVAVDWGHMTRVIFSRFIRNSHLPTIVTHTNVYCCLASCRSDCLLDIAFVIDSSGSIRDTNVGTEDNWMHVIEFMVRVVSSVNVNIGPDRSHVGAVSFGVYFALQPWTMCT